MVDLAVVTLRSHCGNKCKYNFYKFNFHPLEVGEKYLQNMHNLNQIICQSS